MRLLRETATTGDVQPSWDGDIFVSNDTRFQRAAFDELWRPKGKRLETAESFADLMRRLAG
jgi:hypothetical protein